LIYEIVKLKKHFYNSINYNSIKTQHSSISLLWLTSVLCKTPNFLAFFFVLLYLSIEPLRYYNIGILYIVNGTSRAAAALCGLCFTVALSALGWLRCGLILNRPDEVPSMGRPSLVCFRFCSEFPSVFILASNCDLILIKPVWSAKVPREVLLLHCCRRLPGRWSAKAGATET
jgi:hypothetical protein